MPDVRDGRGVPQRGPALQNPQDRIASGVRRAAVDQAGLQHVGAGRHLRLLRRRPRRGQIALVHHHEPRPRRRLRQQRPVVRVERPRSVENDDHRRRHPERGARPAYALGLRLVGRGADSRGIDQGHRNPAEIDGLGHQIPRGPRRAGDDGPLRAAQLVEQGRLARVRAACDGDLAALANQPPPARRGNQGAHLPGQARRFRTGRLRVDEVVALVRKVQRRFQPRHQVEQRLVDGADRRGGGSFQLVEGDARLARGDRGDQVVYRLRLHQVDAAVKKSPERELARLGQPGAGRARRRDDLPERHRTAVPADLHDVLAGVGPRGRKVRRQHAIDGSAANGVERVRQRGVPRLQGGRRRKNRGRHLHRPGSAHADHADAAGTRCRRNGHDRVVGGEHASLRTGPPRLDGLAAPARAERASNGRPGPREAVHSPAVMRTVFMKASPMLSDETPATSATARCTIRRA